MSYSATTAWEREVDRHSRWKAESAIAALKGGDKPVMVEIGGEEEGEAIGGEKEGEAPAAAEAQEARWRKEEPTGKRGEGGDRGEQYRVWDPGGISCA
eukprot:SAG11_NODE_468_length_9209_cov_21.950604_6_plen_98_part_00